MSRPRESKEQAARAKGRPRCDKHGSQICQKYRLETKKLQKDVDTPGIEPGTFHKGAFGQCEAKIIPLDHVPCLWMSRLPRWLLLSNRFGVSQQVRSGPAARRHPLPPAAAGLRPRKMRKMLALPPANPRSSIRPLWSLHPLPPLRPQSRLRLA